MKKLKFWLAGILFTSLATAILININLKYVAADDRNFILTNVEALAQGENGDNECFGSGSVVCGGGLYKSRLSR